MAAEPLTIPPLILLQYSGKSRNGGVTQSNEQYDKAGGCEPLQMRRSEGLRFVRLPLPAGGTL